MVLWVAVGFVSPGVSQAAQAEPPKAFPQEVKRLEAPGLHNLFSIGTNLFSGSAPEGEAGFASLQKLGVKTVITVDGSLPDVETAHKYGLHYIHLPHGYDGIDAATQAALAKAALTRPGPIFVHCHHGLHRGPVAMAVICMADYGWNPVQGNAWLKLAGTATNYLGLFETVAKFQPPTAEQLRQVPSDLPETVRVGDLTGLMVGVDERWDQLKAVRKAGYVTPNDQPDVKPAHEAVILGEAYREAQRLPEAAKKGDDFLMRLKAAEDAVKVLEGLLNAYAQEPKAETKARLDTAFDAVAQKCATCHKAYRDPSFIKSKR